MRGGSVGRVVVSIRQQVGYLRVFYIVSKRARSRRRSGLERAEHAFDQERDPVAPGVRDIEDFLVRNLTLGPDGI